MRAKAEALEAAVREYISAAAEGEAEVQRAAADAAASEEALAGGEAGAGGGGGGGGGMEVEAEGAGAGGGGGGRGTAPAPGGLPAGVQLGPGGSLLLSPGRLPPALRARLRALAPVLSLPFREAPAHRDAYELLAYALERGVGATQEEKAAVAEMVRGGGARRGADGERRDGPRGPVCACTHPRTRAHTHRRV